MRFARFLATGLLALAALVLAAGGAARAAPDATLTVNGTADINSRDGVLTLREAMLLAIGGLSVVTLDSGECAQVSNSTYAPPCGTTDTIGPAAADTIVFDAGVFPPATPATISLSSTLPTLNSGNDTISGAGAGVIVDGLIFVLNCFVISGESSDNNTIEGMQIKRCIDGIKIEAGADNNTIGGTTAGKRNVIFTNTTGVEITGSTTTGNTVQGNYIGTDVTGTAGSGNSFGVLIDNAPNNLVGGTATGARNVISANSRGIFISGGTATGNQIEGNFIGTDSSGVADLGNTIDGVAISLAPSNTIGGTAAGAGNVISGNNRHGVSISGTGSTGNQVQGNLIGTNASGTADLGNSLNGVYIDGVSGNTIGGTAAGARNVISGNDSNGIEIIGSGATGNQVQGNYIGVTADGMPDLGNTMDGVRVDGAASNTIGGTATGAGNVISGNDSNGISISGGETGNQVQGNLIGTSASGNADLGNTLDGVLISLTPSTTVGGTAAGAGNVISGNDSDGIEINGNSATGNEVQGNFIGTTIGGSAGLGNAAAGVRINAAANNIIGGTAAEARNVISGNSFGVFITGSTATGNQVEGNFIGTDSNGTADLGNTNDGVIILGAPSNTIGGTTTGAGNVISGNDRYGVDISGTASTGNQVQGNFLGTDASGTAALGNSSHGVLIDGAPSNTIGGTAAEAGNVISGNNSSGVHIVFGGSNGNKVEGNLIGTDVNGTADLGNTGDGVQIAASASNNIVGGTATGARNIISGNNSNGVRINDSGSTGNVVQGNFIGTDITGSSPLGNGSNGVHVLNSASDNTIGGEASGEPNTLAHQSGDGFRVDGASTTGNTVRGNSIHSNGGKGIETISGGNTELAPPVITLATVSSTIGTTCANCTVDVYSDDSDEGRIHHGFTTADGSGNWSFPGAVTGPNVTATATDATGNTSEFAVLLDNDNDGVLNTSDNCLFVANGINEAATPGVGNQTNTDVDNAAAGFRFGSGSPPPILPGDAEGDACDSDDDNDGFTDAEERIIFNVSAGSAEEHTPCRTTIVADPLPPDTFPSGTPDRLVDGQDMVAFLPGMFKGVGDTGYSARLDIFEPGTVIDGQDLVAMLPFLFKSCLPP